MDPNNNYNPQGTDPNAYGQPGMDPNAYAQPGTDPNAYAQQGMGGYADPNAYGAQPAMDAAAYGAPAPAYGGEEPKKSKTGLIVALCIVAAAIITFAVLLLTGVINFGGGGADGKYELYKVKTGGQEYTLSELSEQYGMDVSSFFQFEVEIKGSKCSVTMYGETMEGEAKVKGDTITLTIDGESLDCPYNKKDGTLTMEIDGEAIVLKKK